jgi:hypothetical protein
MRINPSKEEERRDTFQPSCNFYPGQDVLQWLVKQLQRWSVVMGEPAVSGKEARLRANLVQSSEKDTTHEARKYYPQTILWEDLLFIGFPGRSGFARVLLLHWGDYPTRGVGGRDDRTTSVEGIVRHSRRQAGMLDRFRPYKRPMGPFVVPLGQKLAWTVRLLRHTNGICVILSRSAQRLTAGTPLCRET